MIQYCIIYDLMNQSRAIEHTSTGAEIITTCFVSWLYEVGKSPNEDQCVLLHSNGVCAICLSPKHQLITKYAQNIESVDFHSGSTDRAANRVSGKRKRGGQQLQQQSILCAITCSDGERFSIRSCVQGTLLEVNEQLVSNTSLMVSKTVSDGYIALVLPRLQAADKIVAGLLSEDEYMNRLEIQ
ncbi:protein Abitram-like isoform X2 [Halichondria panicea]|uniref:protein Abitram-like isoform X2 n=1 Tax=Halichondria panicea TaxID=6063 RepID=UPI00312B48BD